MLSFTGGLRVLLAVEPCDMRIGFEGLQVVSERLKEDVRSGALFVFTNKRHTRLKVLYFDGAGLWLMTKRHIPHYPYSGYRTGFVSVSPIHSRPPKPRCGEPILC